MGKTKLMKQYKEACKAKKDFDVLLLLCVLGDQANVPPDYKQHFDGLVNVPNNKTDATKGSKFFFRSWIPTWKAALVMLYFWLTKHNYLPRKQMGDIMLLFVGG